MMQSQFEYAKDHIQQGRMLKGDESSQAGGDKSFGEWPAMNTRAFFVRLMDLIFSTGLIVGFAYFMYREIEKQKGTNFGVSQKNEFEFKKSEEIKERLNDVKGIDEITGEIHNVIRMIKDP